MAHQHEVSGLEHAVMNSMVVDVAQHCTRTNPGNIHTLKIYIVLYSFFIVSCDHTILTLLYKGYSRRHSVRTGNSINSRNTRNTRNSTNSRNTGNTRDTTNSNTMNRGNSGTMM